MIHLLLDTSVLIKWFHSDHEEEVEPSRRILAAHARTEVEGHILDLGVYEVGNVLTRALRWRATDIADQLDDLLAVVGPPIALDSTLVGLTAELATEHGLSFYDAAWAATARALRIPLVSADRRLVEADLAVTPTEVAERLGLVG